jgi:hypothetical protein
LGGAAPFDFAQGRLFSAAIKLDLLRASAPEVGELRERRNMAQEILSVAVWEPLPEKGADSLTTIRELMSIVAAKGYGRDLLYRDHEAHYVFLRYWKSEEARRAAQEDPDMLRCWARLGNEIRIVKVYETLTEVLPDKAK